MAHSLFRGNKIDRSNREYAIIQATQSTNGGNSDTGKEKKESAVRRLEAENAVPDDLSGDHSVQHGQVVQRIADAQHFVRSIAQQPLGKSPSESAMAHAADSGVSVSTVRP